MILFFLWGLLGKILGFEMFGKVVAVSQIGEKNFSRKGVRKWHFENVLCRETEIEVTSGGHLKGYKQNGFVFNRLDYPPESINCF